MDCVTLLLEPVATTVTVPVMGCVPPPPPPPELLPPPLQAVRLTTQAKNAESSRAAANLPALLRRENRTTLQGRKPMTEANRSVWLLEKDGPVSNADDVEIIATLPVSAMSNPSAV